jgi:uncharacterized RDD family membrane protein YckC
VNSHYRLLRYIFLLAVLVLFWLTVSDFDPRRESYANVLAQSVDGRPFVVLAQSEERANDNDTFAVYTPADPELSGWKTALETHSGSVQGVFEIPGNGKDKPGRLGFFFGQRMVSFALKGDGLEPESERKSLAFQWLAETAATLDGKVYAFGGEMPEDPEDSARTLRVARYDNGTFVEMKEKGPQFETGNSLMAKKAGFWLKAVTVGTRIAVLWRDIRPFQQVPVELEEARYSATGVIGMCFFDGEKFTPSPVSIKGLPKGNVSVWGENGKLKLLVQTGSAPSDETQGRMEIWTVADDGSAALSETIPSTRRSSGLFPFIQAVQFDYGGRETILRSTWQNFELWRKGASGSGEWAAVENGTAGLPTFSLERKLWSALGFAASLVLFGALLAVSRRQQAVLLLKRLKPIDLNAPLASRAGAFYLDFTVVFALRLAVVRLYPQTYDDWIWFVLLPPAPALACNLLYFFLSEWLYGATPGKFVMGLRVVRFEGGTYDGGKPSFWSALVRNVAGIWERQFLMTIVVLPMMIFNPRRQRMGDLLARTVVVQKQSLDMFLAQARAEPGGGADTLEPPGEPPANAPL